jgi:hypothetical protein
MLAKAVVVNNLTQYTPGQTHGFPIDHNKSALVEGINRFSVFVTAGEHCNASKMEQKMFKSYFKVKL